MDATETTEIKPETGIEQIEPRPLQLANPEHISRFGSTLQRFIKEKNLFTVIQGKEYANVDGWKFAGINFGLTAICKGPIRIDEDKVVYIFYEKYFQQQGERQIEKERVFYAGTNKEVAENIKEKKTPSRILITELFNYKCEVEIVSLSTGLKVGSGFATCSNAESKKASFDQYAIASMAQTRAIGKSYRNLLGFIMNAAGFENTPAEEMEEKYVTKKETTEDANIIQMPEGEIDLTTQTIIDECKDLADLGELWDKNINLQKNKAFINAVKKRKVEIVKPAKK